MRLFRIFIGRRLASERLRSGVTVVGIALGIAVVVAIRMANTSSVRGFERALEAVSGRTSLEIVSPAGPLDETLLTELAWVRELGRVSPVVEGDVLARIGSGRGEALRVLGVDILRDRPFREYPLIASTEGLEGRRRLRSEEFLRLLIDARAVVLTEKLARRYELDVDDPVDLVFDDRVETFVVRGLLADEGPARILDGNFALMDIAAAQLAFGQLGRLQRIDVRLHDGVGVDAAEQAIASRLPEGLSVERPARRGRQVEKMLAAFHFNLSALSYIALLVGLFLVYDTVSVSVVARRDEIGTLRALGTTRSTILGLFLGEAAVLTAVGCLLGVPLGRLLAVGAVQMTSTTVNTLYVAAAAVVPPLEAEHLLLAFGLGMPLGLLAAAVPAREASRVTPTAAMRGADRVKTRTRLGARHLAVPLAFFGVAWWLCRLPAVDGLPLFGFGAALATVFGGAFLVPAVLFALARVGARPLARVFRVEGRLAHANLAGAIPRIAISVAALSVSLSMMVAVAVMIDSFRETVIYWMGQTLQADLYVGPGRRTRAGSPATLSADVQRAIAEHPQVAAIDRFRSLDVPYGEDLVILGAGEFAVLLEHGNLLFKSPRASGDAREAMRQAIGQDAVVVSESFAIKHGQAAGESILLPTRTGPRPFRVAAIYYDYTSDRGLVVMDRSTFARHFGDARPTRLSVYLREGARPEEVRETLVETLAGRHRVFISTSASLRDRALEIFDSTFTITYALEAIAIFVAIMGVAGTLLTLILERRRELAFLRLVGADRRQVRKMIVVEAGLIGLASQAVGVMVGLVLSLILIYVVNVQSFGWTIQFHLPVLFLAQSSALVLVATALSGIYPARLASQLDVAAEVAEE